eukprot:12287804-Ditylum_brightwellii.AAC.1
MASFLVGQLATVVIRALIRSIADDTLDALIAQGDRQVLEIAHCMHAALFGLPFGILDKPDLLKPLLFCNTVHGMNVLPVALHNAALVHVM